MGDTKARVAELQERRVKLARKREDSEKRNLLGPRLIQKIGECLGHSIDTRHFDTTKTDTDLLDRSDDYRSYPGHVAAYIDSRLASAIVDCCCDLIGPSDGALFFSEYSFLGSLSVRDFELRKLIVIAASLQDEVTFAPADSTGVIAIDFYLDKVSDQENHYSIVVQGKELEIVLAPCFKVKRMLDD